MRKGPPGGEPFMERSTGCKFERKALFVANVFAGS